MRINSFLYPRLTSVGPLNADLTPVQKRAAPHTFTLRHHLGMGSLLKLISPEKATFTKVNLESQDGRVIVITGGYSGVGLELAKNQTS